MAHKESMVLALGGLLLLVAGIAIGAWFGPRFESLIPTDRFVADRMAECGLTVRIHERATTLGDKELEQLVAGDMVSCGVLVSWYPHKIPERNFDTAARITASLEQPVATR